MSSVQVWRAGKFYYQSTPSSGVLPLMERTMSQRRRIIGWRRPGQGTMTGCCCMLVSCLLMCWLADQYICMLFAFDMVNINYWYKFKFLYHKSSLTKNISVQWIRCICLSHILAKEFKMFFPFWKLHVIIHLFLGHTNNNNSLGLYGWISFHLLV